MTRVLLVEDQPAVRFTLERALRLNGYDVTAVDSIGDMQNRPVFDQIDILLSDVLLPGPMDGFALAKRARALWPRLPIVLISGLALANPPADMLSDPLVRLLGKPFTIAALMRAFSELLHSN